MQFESKYLPGKCPVCGGELEYTGESDGDCESRWYGVRCPACDTNLYESWEEVFLGYGEFGGEENDYFDGVYEKLTSLDGMLRIIKGLVSGEPIDNLKDQAQIILNKE